MDYFQVLVLSVVEGVTEFLPVSSTGHLVLASRLLHIPQTDFVKSFELFIQLGAIMAVVALYAKRLWGKIEVWKRIAVAFIPTGVAGLFLYSLVKQSFLGNSGLTVATLLVGGIALIVFELLYTQQPAHVEAIETLRYPKALLIGVFQAAAVIPGVSRAAATIIGGMLVGYSRTAATEFSFLLAVPTVAGATTLDLLRTGFIFSPSEYGLLATGFVVSFLAAWAAVKTFIRYLQKHTLIPFGVYRIILGILFWLFIL